MAEHGGHYAWLIALIVGVIIGYSIGKMKGGSILIPPVGGGKAYATRMY